MTYNCAGHYKWLQNDTALIRNTPHHLYSAFRQQSKFLRPCQGSWWGPHSVRTHCHWTVCSLGPPRRTPGHCWWTGPDQTPCWCLWTGSEVCCRIPSADQSWSGETRACCHTGGPGPGPGSSDPRCLCWSQLNSSSCKCLCHAPSPTWQFSAERWQALMTHCYDTPPCPNKLIEMVGGNFWQPFHAESALLPTVGFPL